ncbi:MAG: bioH [Deltaproteobacteria bacterium]|nr:bioH [Deltaproteobacteria bacterium]
MKWLVVLACVAACGSSAAAPAPSRFEPRSFTVEVTGSGRPIVLLPGLGCSGAVWNETITHLTTGTHRKTVEVHTLTAAGFAGHAPIEGPLTATMRAELADYIRDRHLDHPVIVGHSMGGFLAIWLAETEPDLVGPIVSIDSSPAPGDEAWARRIRDSWATLSAGSFAKEARRYYGGMFTDPKQLELVLADVVRSDPRTMAATFYELFTTDLRPKLAQIKVPVLAILADGPHQQAIRARVAKIPSHEVIVVPHTRHFVMQDDPAGFQRALDGFLAAHPPGSAGTR